MNMFKFLGWGFAIGLSSVGLPAFLLVAVTDARTERSAWLTALAATLVGAVWAAALAPRKNAGLGRAAWLGACAWFPTLIVCALFIAGYCFLYLPILIVISVPVLLAGAGIGAAVAGTLRLEGLDPPVIVMTRPRRRLTPPRRRFRV